MKINALQVATKDRPKSFCALVHTLFSLAVAIVVFSLLSGLSGEQNNDRQSQSQQANRQKEGVSLTHLPLR